MPDVDAVVIGAGVIGIAAARALALSGSSVLLLEGEDEFGSCTSSRNSEVIHAGIYYPAGSAKARLCVEGRHRLYRYCDDRGVPHRRTGKLIFAAHEGQLPALEALERQALLNGVDDLRILDKIAVRAMEPALECSAAISSPSTGIVDVHALMLAMLGDFEGHGGIYVARSRVSEARQGPDGWKIYVNDDEDPAVTARLLVNAAGLFAQKTAAKIEGLDVKHIPPAYLARGAYFSYSGKIPFKSLIYPLPEPGGLGLHLTLDLGNNARFGPDVEWVSQIDYRVDESRKPAFLEAARRIWPAIDPHKLQPGYAGIRPKLAGPGEPPGDFVISGPDDHGCVGLVNLFGIESPGLTAALAIGDRIVEALHQ